MQAVVKMPHIKINIKGEIPKRLLTLLKTEYGKECKIIKEASDDSVNVFETDWYKKTKAKITPGDNMKIYREIHGMTQSELGKKLGGIPRQHVSNMERGTKPISLKTARKLSELFRVSIEKFV